MVKLWRRKFSTVPWGRGGNIGVAAREHTQPTDRPPDDATVGARTLRTEYVLCRVYGDVQFSLNRLNRSGKVYLAKRRVP